MPKNKLDNSLELSTLANNAILACTLLVLLMHRFAYQGKLDLTRRPYLKLLIADVNRAMHSTKPAQVTDVLHEGDLEQCSAYVTYQLTQLMAGCFIITTLFIGVEIALFSTKSLFHHPTQTDYCKMINHANLCPITLRMLISAGLLHAWTLGGDDLLPNFICHAGIKRNSPIQLLFPKINIQKDTEESSPQSIGRSGRSA